MVKVDSLILTFGDNTGVNSFYQGSYDVPKDFNVVAGIIFPYLESKGLNIRHVFGELYEDLSQPGNLVQVENPGDVVQDLTTATKATLGGTTPYGGKGADFLIKLAEQGMISWKEAYVMGAFLGERTEYTDNEGKIVQLSIDAMNTLTGGPEFSPTQEGGLFVNGDYAGVSTISYIRGKDGELKSKPAWHVPIGLDTGRITSHFEDMVVTLAMGLNSADQKNGVHTVTFVLNGWGYVNGIEGMVAGAETKRVVSTDPSRLGQEDYHKTTVSNQGAILLWGQNYQRLTGKEPHDKVPTRETMFAFREAREVGSLDEVVEDLRRAA